MRIVNVCLEYVMLLRLPNSDLLIMENMPSQGDYDFKCDIVIVTCYTSVYMNCSLS